MLSKAPLLSAYLLDNARCEDTPEILRSGSWMQKDGERTTRSKLDDNIIKTLTLRSVAKESSSKDIDAEKTHLQLQGTPDHEIARVVE